MDTTYNLKVLLVSATIEPLKSIYLALRLPTKKTESINYLYDKEALEKRIREVYNKGHLNFLEFIDVTFFISNISGACLRQFRTHRIASYMSSSLHYQTAEKDKFSFPNDTDKETIELADKCYLHYIDLINKGKDKETARLILPVASSYNILAKFNARSLDNFFTQRLCRTNCKEILQLANEMYRLCLVYCPSVFELMGRKCTTCKQNYACGLVSPPSDDATITRFLSRGLL